MASEREVRVEELFSDALEIAEAERGDWLQRVCAADRELLAEVQSLLAAFARAPALIDPACLPGRGSPAADAEPDPMAGRCFGPWRVLRLIASGGMGAVYLGERIDEAFQMKVAIKVLAAGSFHPGLQTLFRAERQVLADLDHPGIARLLDGGTTPEGAPYFVMEYVDGATIRDAARDRRLTLKDRLRLFLEVADAVQYAHTNLVIHRDLKPGNIIVRVDGHPKLLDFGIAKVLHPAAPDHTEAAGGTAFAFTPRYASPEQIRGQRVTTATDIYSLGVVLYELLTGQLPYALDGDSVVEIGNEICDRPPLPPSRLRGVPDARRFAGDLDTILLKALAKDPRRRYASAADFADDVRRHLDGEPVLARGDSAAYRLSQFTRRNRTLVSGVLLFTAALLVALLVTLGFYRRATASAAMARWYAYTSTVAAAEAAILNHNMTEARELLAGAPVDFQGWEYWMLTSRLDRSLENWPAHAAGITRLRFSRDGSEILTTSVDRTARLWRTATRESLAAWSFDRELESGGLLAGNDRIVVGLTDGRVMTGEAGGATALLGRGSAYAILDVHPDGRTVAAGFENGEVALFDAVERRELRRWKAHYRLAAPVFSPDRLTLATCGADSLVRIWNLADGRLRATLRGHRHRVFNMAFSPDGRRLASGARDRTATVWDLETGVALCSFSEHRGTPSPLVFASNGASVISAGSEGRVIEWDPATGARIGEYHGQRTDVSAIDVSPGADLVATGEWNGTVRLWAPRTDDVPSLSLAPSGDIIPFVDIDFDPTGRRMVAAAALSYQPARWTYQRDLLNGRTIETRTFGLTAVAAVDSVRLVCGTNQGRIILAGSSPTDSTMAHMGGVRRLVRAGPGTVFSAGEDGFIRLWELPELHRLREWRAHTGAVAGLALDPKRRILATAGVDGWVRTWNADSGDSLRAFQFQSGSLLDLALDPAGRWLAFVGANGATGLVDPRAGTVDTLLAAGSGARCVTFSPDGLRIVVGGADGMLRIFEADRRLPILRLHGHLSRVDVVRFTPDGRSLVSGSHDGSLRVWTARPPGGGAAPIDGAGYRAASSE